MGPQRGNPARAGSEPSEFGSAWRRPRSPWLRSWLPTDLTGGPAAVCELVSQLRRAFSDLQVEVEILLESGDRVAWQRTIRATHRASYQGFPATGRAIVWRDMVTSRFEEDRIVEDWALSDLAEQLLRARKR